MKHINEDDIIQCSKCKCLYINATPSEKMREEFENMNGKKLKDCTVRPICEDCYVKKHSRNIELLIKMLCN